MNDQWIECPMLLIFGMPRSGTTWLGKIFDSHPDVIYLHEPDSDLKIKSVPRLVIQKNYSQYKDLVYQYSLGLLDKCAIHVNGKLPFFNKTYLSNSKNTLFKANLMLAKLFDKIHFYIPVWNPLKSASKNESVIAWKSIESCGRIGLIMEALPECKAVYIIRHPCGQIASVLNGEKDGKFSSKTLNAEDFSLFKSLLKSNYATQHNLSIEKIKAMKPIERLAIRWVLYNEQAIESFEESGNRAMIVRYEDICNNTVEETKKLYAFANLNWNSQTKQFIEKSTHNNSDGYYSVYKNPALAVSKWRKHLSDEDINLIKNTVSKSKAGKLFANSF